MKRCKLTITLKDGTKKFLAAYDIGNGIFVHRNLYNGEQTTRNYWTISIANGAALLCYNDKPRPLRDIVNKAIPLTKLDWNFSLAEWNKMDQEPYKELLREVKS